MHPCALLLLFTAQPTLYQEVHLTLKGEVFQLLLCWPELLRSVFMSGNLRYWAASVCAAPHCDDDCVWKWLDEGAE